MGENSLFCLLNTTPGGAVIELALVLRLQFKGLKSSFQQQVKSFRERRAVKYRLMVVKYRLCVYKERYRRVVFGNKLYSSQLLFTFNKFTNK